MPKLVIYVQFSVLKIVTNIDVTVLTLVENIFLGELFAGLYEPGSSCRFLHSLNEDKLDAAIDEQCRGLTAAEPGFRTPSGSLPMSPSSPMNQRGKATLIPGSTQQEGGADYHWEVLDPVHDQVVLDDGEEASAGCGSGGGARGVGQWS
ncbi:uncharacterized protein A4U43_C10F14400 [Asparagus officinalis]|uniref:Uncharacterized protein n=1 Tax=Asparagus officinalis TaxID=4686 RepID=A0A5P1E7H3_ASPOF|nr:uncharacterized protein A4U43_C10F14400 [Asparagus officinalis]